jgi:hypothetical protein
MSHPIAHFLSDHFPDVHHPAYQTAVERVGFVVVTMVLAGLITGALAIVLFSIA